MMQRTGGAMNWRVVIVGFVLVLMVGGGLAFRRSAKAEAGFRSGVFEPPRAAPDFELDGSHGSRLHLHDYLGKVVVLEFGFTFCHQVCPVTLANLVEVHKKLGAAASDVRVIFVTVDPKRDTPPRLREYLTVFNPTFVGATGLPTELEAVRESYGIIAKEVVFPNKESGYDHSSFIYLIDRRGNIRSLVPFGKAPDDVVHDIKLLLKQ